MKLKVHRVRFVEYVPQAINCLAFEDTRGKNRLAVSRYVCLQDPLPWKSCTILNNVLCLEKANPISTFIGVCCTKYV